MTVYLLVLAGVGVFAAGMFVGHSLRMFTWPDECARCPARPAAIIRHPDGTSEAACVMHTLGLLEHRR